MCFATKPMEIHPSICLELVNLLLGAKYPYLITDPLISRGPQRNSHFVGVKLPQLPSYKGIYSRGYNSIYN